MTVTRPVVTFLFSTVTLLALQASPSPPEASIQGQDELTALVDSYYDALVLDETGAIRLEDVFLERDLASFRFKAGTLYPTRAINGIVTAAVFLGQGSVRFEPRRALDRRCLELASKQHLKKPLVPDVDVPVQAMVILAYDGDLAGLLASSAGRETSHDNRKASEVLRDRVEVMKEQEIGFDLAFAERIAGMDEGLVRVDFLSPEHGWLLFSYSPADQFEVYLRAIEKVGRFHSSRPLLVTHRREDFDPAGNYVADPVADQKSRIDVKAYRLEITIPNTEHFLIEADITFAPLIDGLPVVNFDLVNNVAGVKSTDRAKPIILNQVSDADGNPIPFVHRKNQVLLLAPAPLKAGTDYTYRFSLDNQIIRQLSSVHYQVLNTYPWFPQHGYNGGHYRMDWTIRARKPLVATGSGRLVKEDSQGDFNTTHLLFDRDVQFPSLLFGRFQRETAEYERKPGGGQVALSTFSWPSAEYVITDPELVLLLTSGRQSTPLPYTLDIPPSKPRSILEEAKEILKFCEELYGPFPYDTLNIAQMAPFVGFGQAPPGLVQLTGDAFMSPANVTRVGDLQLDFSKLKMDGFHEFFAHEIAHQWWGHVVVWSNDEDVWLSEAFAEYTAGLYVMQLLGQDRFQGKLKEWRDGARMADTYAPIAWATRLRGQVPGGMSTPLIYDKGPYVVHMLRMQVGHENFVKAARSVMTKYAHRPITTYHLQREFEEVVGYKLDYFFDQWLRSTGIPTFDYWTDVRQGDDGKWTATIRTTQRDKQNVKIVSMPVFFHFGKDKVMMRQRPILSAEDVYQIKLPEKPQRITLDDYNTLLADLVPQGSAGR